MTPCGLAACEYGPLWAGRPSKCMVVVDRPYKGPSHGQPPPFLAAFAAKMQQGRVEQFYVIQSHHTYFKTNLSHENLGSDTTIGKPQWEHHMRSRRSK
ncbi:hypothetical protein BHE74_00039804 [Ensete ventricosum]|nr:hypothetical protein GW17_00024920 [Ensete ventricosum]RWW53691.1 hypothetical protein BHE74_00039804 [Ensete ventricosum]RZS14329.1 hypothetical protein BHM03_00046007 [Ensete ventricosum]